MNAFLVPSVGIICNRMGFIGQSVNAVFEKEFITQALTSHDWNIAATAKTLELDRTNLYKKMQQYGIKR